MTATQPDWSNIGKSDGAKYFVDYLDTVTAQSEMQRYKRRTYQLLGITAGARILDVGCGTGDDALAMAELVGSCGQIVGLDYSPSLIEEAHQRVKDGALPVDFTSGDVHRLDFPDNSFDGCRADRVFMHLRDREQALAEMIRVTRPGGRIVVREPDWDTLIVDSPERELTRRIVTGHFDRVIRNGWAGRDLYRQFRQAGLERVEIADTSTLVLTDLATADRFYGLADAARTLGEAEPECKDRADAWIERLRAADRAGLFFSAVTGFTAVGVVP
jgi:ubiquinone/menaquinone biosynthesis C-methylase UbiE